MRQTNINIQLKETPIENKSSSTGLFPRPSFSFSNVENDVLMNPYRIL